MKETGFCAKCGQKKFSVSSRNAEGIPIGVISPEHNIEYGVFDHEFQSSYSKQEVYERDVKLREILKNILISCGARREYAWLKQLAERALGLLGEKEVDGK